jgi:hypothetical protein
VNGQLLIVMVLVAAASLFLVRQTWRAWAGRKAGCGGGCGCASKPNSRQEAPLIAPEQLTQRLRQTHP